MVFRYGKVFVRCRECSREMGSMRKWHSYLTKKRKLVCSELPLCQQEDPAKMTLGISIKRLFPIGDEWWEKPVVEKVIHGYIFYGTYNLRNITFQKFKLTKRDVSRISSFFPRDAKRFSLLVMATGDVTMNPRWPFYPSSDLLVVTKT